VLRLEKGGFEEKHHGDWEQRTNHHRIPTFLSTNEANPAAAVTMLPDKLLFSSR
jgi:hypothetical protein